MKTFYETWHPDRGYGKIWGYEEYGAVAKNLLKYGKCMSIGIHKDILEIEIFNKRVKGKKMPRDMRKYLLSEGLEITKVKRVGNLTVKQLFKIERKARRKGKTVLPVGIEDGYCLIRYLDAPYQGPKKRTKPRNPR